MAVVSPTELIHAERPSPARGTYWVQTWGCQMNEEDSEQIGLHLASVGFAPASSIGAAHLILLNTCSVRKKPEDKAFSLLGELAILKRQRPEIIVGVCGCMAQLQAEGIKRRAPFVDFVVGTGQIATIPGLVEEAAQGRRFQTRLDLPARQGAIVTEVPRRLVPGTLQAPQAQARRKLKAFVPIQYGCDKFCAFCIVPTTRGRERSRPTAEIVSEVRALAEQGTKEVTLLGQTVNSYGKNLSEGRVPFAKLLWLLAGIPELERIRYTSPYPRDFTSELISCIRECPKVMEHVHLPLQSGDDDVLRAMRRRYSSESFLRIVSDLRTSVPSLSITTDVIVGFPGETDRQFDRTLEMVRSIRFDGAFMFIYSPRPGTPAAELEQLPFELKRDRLNALAEIQNEITVSKNREWIGRIVEVLVEGPSPKDPDRWQGYSREFKMVHFPGADSMAARTEKVLVEGAHLWGLSGKPLCGGGIRSYSQAKPGNRRPTVASESAI